MEIIIWIFAIAAATILIERDQHGKASAMHPDHEKKHHTTASDGLTKVSVECMKDYLEKIVRQIQNDTNVCTKEKNVIYYYL